MKLKRIYFVRHGETEANKERLMQGHDQPLSEVGMVQADKVAQRAKNLDFEKVISSDMLRAKQTADAIVKLSEHTVETSTLFREKEIPSRFIGLSKENPEVKEYQEQQNARRADIDWRFEDAENFDDLLNRAKEAMDFLERTDAESLLVVTHGTFLKVLILTLLTREKIDASLWEKIGLKLHPTNTGITACTFDEKHDRWVLLTWNDHAHFAE